MADGLEHQFGIAGKHRRTADRNVGFVVQHGVEHLEHLPVHPAILFFTAANALRGDQPIGIHGFRRLNADPDRGQDHVVDHPLGAQILLDRKLVIALCG